jgi:uncharacterized membrane protein YphA (DoxX/SURF4 family)
MRHGEIGAKLVRTHQNIKGVLYTALSYRQPYGIVRLALAGLFIYAGVIKLFAPRAFAATISTYGLIPDVMLPVVAIGLPALEAVAGLALVFDRSWGLHLITGLLALFVLVLGYGILSELKVDCGCFGAEDLDKQASLRAAFYRDLVLIGIVVPYLYLARRIRALSSHAA